jgi:peptidoglycan hydrolase CwlO-like protein
MRSIYKTGSSSVLSVVLGSSSPEEIVSNIYIADKIADQDAQAIATVLDLEQQLSTEMTDLQVHKDKQEDTLAATQKKADAYTAKVDEARRTYESLDSQVQQALAEQAAAEAEAAAQAAAQGEEVEQQSNQSIVISAIEDTPAPEAETTPETATTPADTPSSGGTKTSTQTKTSETTDTPAKTKTPSKEQRRPRNHVSVSSSPPELIIEHYSGGGLGFCLRSHRKPYVSGCNWS